MPRQSRAVHLLLLINGYALARKSAFQTIKLCLIMADSLNLLLGSGCDG